MIKKRQSERNGKAELKARGRIFLLLYTALSSSGPIVGRESVWPQYFCVPAILDSNVLSIQPGGDTAKGTVASTILGHAKGTVRSHAT